MGKTHYAWKIVLASCAINCLSGIISSSSVNFFTPVAEDFQIGIGQISLYMTIMLLTAAIFLPIFGQVIEKHLKGVLLFAGAVQSSFFALLGMFHHAYQFWIAGVFMGMGVAVTYSLATPVLINMWFKKKQGLATGIAFSFLGISGAAFSMIAGHLIVSAGWRYAYFTIGSCAALIYIPAIVLLVKTPQEKGVLPYGYEADAQENMTVTAGEKIRNGLTLQQALHHPSFYLMLSCAILVAIVGSESTQIPTFSVNHFGMSIETGSQIMAVNSIGVTIGTVALGMICDKIGKVKTMLLAMGLCLLGNIILLIGPALPLSVKTATFIIGFGFPSVTVLMPLFGMYIFGAKEYTRIWSIILSAASIASASAVSLYGFIYDITLSYSTVFFLVAVLSALVAIISIAAVKSRARF